MGSKLRQGGKTAHCSQETMFKAGTLPLKMYATSLLQNEKVMFQQARPLEASAVEKDHEEVQSELSVEASSDTEDAEHESEYDTESESEEQLRRQRG